MNDTKPMKTLLSGLALSFALTLGLPNSLLAADLSDPALVMDEYLVSLVNGDTDGILERIDGRMKSKNRALELSPDSYSEFLQTHYEGVQTAVEELSPENGKIRARVRFDYPNADSSVIDFILTQTDGQWKISNEDY